MSGERFALLTGLDASFLHQEVGSACLAIGGCVIVDGPPPELDEFRRQVARRLDGMPRFHQRLRRLPYPGGQPYWVDDADFSIDYHVRHLTLPPPGGECELWDLMAQVFAQRLDRSRPLWEVYLVDGMGDGGFTVIIKCHHALADGMANVDVVSLILDMGEGTGGNGGMRVRWSPRAEPSAVAVTREMTRRTLGIPARAARATVGAVRHPGGLVDRAKDGVRAAAELGRIAATPAPHTPFNVDASADRCFACETVDLGEVKAVKNAFGATVNDVVLTLAAGGLRELLLDKGADPDELELVASVPVSLRRSSIADVSNEVIALRAALPVDVADSVVRLELVKREMRRVKRSPQASVVGALESLIDAAPDWALGPLARLSFSPRVFNVLVTNLPGPQFQLSVQGQPVRNMVPAPPLTRGQGLAIAVLSYYGGLSFGVLAAPSAVPNLEPVLAGIRRSLEELSAAAERPSTPSRGEAALT
jgi:diacylglycerol O-acyltransferase